MQRVLPIVAAAALIGGPAPVCRAETPIGPLLQRIERMPPAQRLGARAQLLKSAQRLVPVVVVVPDAASAARAIAAWDGLDRFPVLIDDGTPAARAHAARFIRAFEPERVVRWEAEDAETPDREGLVSLWLDAVGAPEPATEEGGAEDLIAGGVEHLRRQRLTPSILVGIDLDDPAWVGGLTLAAGRFGAPVFFDSEGKLSGAVSAEWCDALGRSLGEAATGAGLTWRVQGDDIDAVCLVHNGATKIGPQDPKGKAEYFAVTDRVTRLTPDAEPWAWAGQIIGDGPAALYRVMCGLFLQPGSAWVFDSYPSTGGWKLYDGTAAARALAQSGRDVTVFDDPNQGIADWHAGVAGGLDAGLVLINTKGGPVEFNLQPGVGRPGDAPVLHTPTIVHMVHSFSLARVGSRATVGGRWLENGAYAYYGSVHEPLLKAFVPTPQVAARLVSGLALGAAVRVEGEPAWKLNLIGDPLVTVGRPIAAGRRVEGAGVPLGPVSDLETELATAREKGQHLRALRLLEILGRDEEAAELGVALLDGGGATAGVAEAMAMPLFRTGRAERLVEAAALFLGPRHANTEIGDALWHTSRARSDERLENLLKLILRPGQQIQDGIELGEAIRARHGAGAARAWLASLAEKARTPKDTRQLERALKAVGG